MDIIRELPEIFETFAEARKNGFLAAKDFKDQGKPLIGTYCTYMPQELPMAMDAGIVGLCAMSGETIQESEKQLPRNLCPLIKSSFGFGITDKCPYFYFSDLVVGETTCDGKKKMYELMGEFKDVHVMQLPNGPKGEHALNLWKHEIHVLRELLEEKFGTKITDESLKEAIQLKNRERQALKNLYQLQMEDDLKISGADLLKILYGAMFKFDKEQSITELENAYQKIKNSAEVLPKKPRIIVTGCPIGGVTEKVVKAIEDGGAYVVYFENCTGAKAVEELVDESEEDLELALAKKYLNIGCSCMTPNETRMEIIRQAAKDYKADGIIDVTLTACHTYAVETMNIKKLAESEGLAYLNLETDYSESDIGQLSTRSEAFIEML